jgi:sulfate adenylyltransferase large subunit
MVAAARLAESTENPSDVAAWLRAQEEKELLRFVAIGSVDDGKSTLIGRLLHDAQGLYEDQLDAVRRASAKGSTRGQGSTSEIDFSLFTDGLAAEREQGITIDVAYRYFATDRRKFIIADTPGHVQYTRNMATGASTADVAVILVDARLGVLPQTRRHAHIAALLGIRRVVACVNKMDLVGFDRAVFDAIHEELRAVAKKLGLAQISAIPISALRGDNVVARSTNMPFWTGPTVLEHLETLPLAGARDGAALRLPVQLVLRPGLAYRGYAGRIVAGVVRPGDTVVALPSGRRTRVAAVDVDGAPVSEAFAPMNVSLRLADEIDVSRGDMIVEDGGRPRVTTDVEADLVWMSEAPLDRGKSYLLKHTTRRVRAEVSAVLHRTDPETLERVPADTLRLNDIARVRVHCHSPIFVDPYVENRATGSFILVDSVTNDTVAAGMIARSEGEAAVARDRSAGRTHVSARERRARLDQAGAVVTVRAPALDEARSLAFAIERELFDRGRVATVVERAKDPLDAAGACAAAGVIAIVPAAGAAGADIGGEPIDAREGASLEESVAAALEERGLFGEEEQ